MKIAIAALAVLSMLTTPVLADNTETYNYNYNYNYKYNNGNSGNDDALYALGGLLGGLVIGGVINNQRARVYGQEYCGTRWENRWNAVYQTWEKIPHTVCWVQ